MTAVLLCPGPSLAALDAMPECDVSIAVNRAVLKHFGVDWWCSLDYPMIRDNLASVTAPNLLSIRQTITDLNHRLSQFRFLCAAEDFVGRYPAELKATTYSATTALVFAAFMGAKRIDVYGADWKGTQDYDGKEAGENRKDERWTREAFVWGGIVDYLAGTGVEVRRHVPVTA